LRSKNLAACADGCLYIRTRFQLFLSLSALPPFRAHAGVKASDEDLFCDIIMPSPARYCHAVPGKGIIMPLPARYCHAVPGKGIIMPLLARFCHAVPGKGIIMPLPVRYCHAVPGKGIIMPLPARYCHAVPVVCRIGPQRCISIFA
jgi:hypothetical protein